MGQRLLDGWIVQGYVSHMERATISQIKNRLSAYLKKVRAGESVLILDRDEPIARLERVISQDHPADRLARLERAGLVHRAEARLDVDQLRRCMPQSSACVVEALLDDRRDDR